MRRTLFTSCLILVSPFVLTAQTTVPAWSPPQGSLIRVAAPMFGHDKQVGTLMSATADSVVFRPKSLSNTVSVATMDIRRMDVGRGTHTRKMKGALIGFVTAAVLGGAITAATWQKPKNCFACFDFGRSGDAAFIGGFSGLLGAIVGGIVGSRATESWEPVFIPR